MTCSPEGFDIEFPHETQREPHLHQIVRSSYLLDGRTLSLVDALL